MSYYRTYKGFCLALSLIAISGCTVESNTTSELINAPTFPKNFSNIPSSVEESGLKKLQSSKKFIKSITVGRVDPFRPPSYQSVELSIPNSFKFLGLISIEKKISAFVSFDNESGTIKEGDIGGKTTTLLPNGWVVSSLNKDTEILELNFKDSKSTLKLRPEKKYNIKKLR